MTTPASTPTPTLGVDLRVQTPEPRSADGRSTPSLPIMSFTFTLGNFAYVGTRTTGYGVGSLLVVALDGMVLTGVTKVIRADTHFVFIVYERSSSTPPTL